MGRSKLVLLAAMAVALVGYFPAERGAERVPASRVDASATFTLLFSGDVLVHVPVANSAKRHALGSEATRYDFTPMFGEIGPVITAADLAICHLETPLDADSRVVSGFPSFSTPAEIASALASAGFDGCSTASNHALDLGEQGLRETVETLRAVGLQSTGTGLSRQDRVGTLYELPGLTVGHSSYTYGFSSGRIPSDGEWQANAIDAERIVTNAALLRRRGADFVVVSLHWGTEYAREPSAAQWDLARTLLASHDIDLVVGHHSHTVQPIALLGGKPVFFSLGNLLSNQTASCCTPQSEEGLLLLVRVGVEGRRWVAEDLAYVPTWVDRRSGHVIRAALGNDPAGPAADRLHEAASRTAATLGQFAVQSDGLSVRDAIRWIAARHALTTTDWFSRMR